MNHKSDDTGAGTGCQNQTWETPTKSANILSTLSTGKYSLEVYLDAPGYLNQTPSTAYYSNNGSNFIASFYYINEQPADYTIWDGSAWSNGIPSNTKDAFINGDYFSTGFTARNLTINSGYTLKHANDAILTAAGTVVNNGTIYVRDLSNFNQLDGSTYTGSGTFTSERTSKTATGKYALWSSAVQNEDMYNIFPTTSQYVLTYNSNTDYYNLETAPALSVAGKGYAVKVPTDTPTATFTGIPNNGDITVTLDNDASDNPNGNTWNLIGNPYPSRVSLTLLYNGGTMA